MTAVPLFAPSPDAVGVRVLAVPFAEVLPLRHAVLHPETVPATDNLSCCAHDGDIDPAAVHWAAYSAEGRVLGVVSLVPDEMGVDGVLYPWRRRGLAVDGSARGLGIGRLVYAAMTAHIRAHGLSTWGWSREAWVPFYVRMGARATEHVSVTASGHTCRLCVLVG